MNNKLVLVKPSNKSQAGFSMLESMVAAMVSLIFMSMGANLVLAANIQKIIAKRNVAMNNFVQSDLDGIRYQATILERDDTKCNPTDTTNSYAATLKERLGSNKDSDIITGTIRSNSSQTTVKALDRKYTMTRTLSYDSTNSRILNVDYKFTYGNGNDSTIYYRLYTEVMPTVASKCSS